MSGNFEPSSGLNERSTVASRFRIPKRYVQALLASLSLFIVYWMKTSFHASLHYIIVNTDEREMPWRYEDMFFMSSASTLGFIVAQIPAALLMIKFSSHRILLVSILLATILHTILSLCISSSAAIIIAVQFLQGIAEGAIYPAYVDIWKSWAPPSERTTLFSIILCGSYFGTVAGAPANMALAENFGEKACFYVSSVCGLIWCLVWCTQAYESPSSHPHISHSELDYLEKNVVTDNRQEVTVKSVPWMSILMSLPAWVICLANLCYTCSTFILAISPDMYYSIELGTMKHHTMLDFLLPYAILGVVVSVSGFFADFLINRAHLSRSTVRKLYCSGGFALHGIAFLIIRYYRDIDSTLICIHLAYGFLGLSTIGFLVNCLDLSPPYASIVMAACQAVGGIGEVIAPLIMRQMDDEKIMAWSAIFDTLISASFVIALIYACFGSGNMQDWGNPGATCSEAAEDEVAISTYYSYPDGADCVELVADANEEQSANASIEPEEK